MYLLDITENYSEAYWFKYEQTISPDHLLFISGEKQPTPTTTPTFKNNKKISKTRLLSFDLFQSDTLEFVSSKMAHVLRSYENDVQIFPADVYLKEEKLNDFFVFNVVQTLSCIDMNYSEYKPMFSFMPDGPIAFSTIKSLPSTALSGHDIVRAKESPQRLFVSERFKQHCEAAQLKGLRFTDCSKPIQV
ncbi:imm11 family protein [Pseudomonas sp. P9_31]|uniref:imm11 family protein n=1 Tax=Pseudomonas sp. P9_31 TaxID=3043448 RepID=UPI002A358A5B|nr:DUF1629 domain-containing protein [Pseudomonas sp. P9_31]WPN57898.1 hypothetical protein QMK51_27965 [Pseudomonas sp. P9_31]